MKIPQKMILAILIAIAILAGPLMQPAFAFDFSKNSGISDTGTAAGYSASLQKTTPAEVAGLVVKILLGFIGVIFLGFLIYGGFIWMMARGNESDVDKAKKMIEQSVVGLIVVLAAYAIASFVSYVIKY